MAVSAALLAQSASMELLHTAAADDAGGWTGWADAHVFDTTETVATPDAMRDVIETWRLAGGTTDVDILCDWDGDLSITTTNVYGPASGTLTANAGVFGGYNRPAGGLRIRPATGREPFIDSSIRLYGMPKIEFNGIGFDTYADGGDGENIRCVQLQRNPTYPIPHAVVYKNCKIGRMFLHPSDSFTEYVQSLDQNGSLALSVHFENNTFWGCRDPMAAQALFVRVKKNYAHEYIGDFSTQFSFSAANSWTTSQRCNVLIEGNFSWGIVDNAALSSLHQDFNQTGTAVDNIEGYSVLSRYNVGYGAVALSGGFQGMYNDDHATAGNEFVFHDNIFCTTSPHGLSLWNTSASFDSYVENNMVVAPGLRKTNEDWTSGFICNEAEGESDYGTLQVNNNILGRLTLNGETATTTGNVFVSPVKNVTSGDGTSEAQAIRHEDYLSGTVSRDGTDFLTYTPANYSSTDIAEVFYGIVDMLEPLTGWGGAAGPSDPESWPTSLSRPGAVAPTMPADTTVSIDENTTAVGTFAASSGSETITYSLSGTDSALFTINSSTGAVVFDSAPDYESPGDANTDNDYLITVTATNSEGSDSQSITVTVNDVAEGASVNNFVANGSSYITAPTLGNLLSSTLRITASYAYWATTSGTLFSQAGSGNKEFEFYRNGGSTYIVAGGTTTNIGNFAAIFGDAILDDDLIDLEIDFTTGAFTLDADGVEVDSGTLTVGASRVDGCLFRIGARSTNQTSGSTGGANILASGEKVGDVAVYIDDVRERNYVMPSGTDTNVPDTENGQDGTLRGGTGDGSDWEVLGPANVLPVATAQSVSVTENIARVITVSGTDSDGTLSDSTVVVDVSNGTLVKDSAFQYTYTPDADYTGSDSFTFTVTDNSSGVSAVAATVNITVAELPPNSLKSTIKTEIKISLKTTILT